MHYTRGEAKQWAKENIEGFFLCPVTPVNNDFNFDEEGMRANVEAFIDMGVDGLVVGGFIAECWNATLEEWYRYHEVMAEAVAGRIPLFSIILDPSAYQAVEKMQRLEAMGFDGVEVINPVVQLRTDDEIFDWFKFITDRSDMAVMLYRTPVSGKVLGWDLMNRLADLDTVVGAKQGVVNRLESLKLRNIMRDDFVLSDPLEPVFLDDLRRGGQVVFGELSYILYGKKRHLVNEYRALAAEGKWEEAYQKSEQLADVRDFYGEVFLWDVVHTFTYASALASMKAWFEEIGLQAGPIRPPVSQCSDELRQRIKTNLKEFGVT
ncbi:MAG: dihydrodipicolinate synthase family protein [Gammaproteobacteria bacterium]